MALELLVDEVFTRDLANAVRSGENIYASFPITKSYRDHLANELERSHREPEVEKVYRSAAESPLGRKLTELLDKKDYPPMKVDYYTYLDLGDKARAIYMRMNVSGRGPLTVLGVNKKLQGDMQRFNLDQNYNFHKPKEIISYIKSHLTLLTMLHEYVHARGEFSEKTDYQILKDIMSAEAEELKGKIRNRRDRVNYAVLRMLAKICDKEAMRAKEAYAT